jgi:SMP-30/Gluconolactonase/LRE-like region
VKKTILWSVAAAGLALAGLAIAFQGHDARAANSDTCSAFGDMKFICGLNGPEDLMPLPNSKWMIASGMQVNNMPGHFYLIDSGAKTAEELFPGANPKFAQDKTMFANCPGPVDVTNFSVHGLSLRPASAGHYKMYITSHGGREAVEAFDLDTTGAKPSLTWVGCVLLPQNIFINSVAVLPDGGFVVTKMIGNEPNAFAGIQKGEVTGLVYEWHPGNADVKAVPGTELSGPNGIEISEDGKTMYVAAMGNREIIKYSLGDKPMRVAAAKLDIMVDNVHWAPNGKLLTAGGVVPVPGAASGGPGAPRDSKVYEIDPDTMAATELAVIDGKNPVGALSTGAEAAGDLWVGTPRGDRVGYVPLK